MLNYIWSYSCIAGIVPTTRLSWYNTRSAHVKNRKRLRQWLFSYTRVKNSLSFTAKGLSTYRGWYEIMWETSYEFCYRKAKAYWGVHNISLSRITPIVDWQFIFNSLCDCWYGIIYTFKSCHLCNWFNNCSVLQQVMVLIWKRGAILCLQIYKYR